MNAFSYPRKTAPDGAFGNSPAAEYVIWWATGEFTGAQGFGDVGWFLDFGQDAISQHAPPNSVARTGNFRAENWNRVDRVWFYGGNWSSGDVPSCRFNFIPAESSALNEFSQLQGWVAETPLVLAGQSTYTWELGMWVPPGQTCRIALQWDKGTSLETWILGIHGWDGAAPPSQALGIQKSRTLTTDGLPISPP